ncbi:hypothetical protein N9955_00405 [bacterium]|nr:hypothetical protein [bacterium]
MSDTPRTDAFAGKCHSYHKNQQGQTLFDSHEELERELAEAKAELREANGTLVYAATRTAKAELEADKLQGWVNDAEQAAGRLQVSLNTANAQANKLREAVRSLLSAKGRHNTEMAYKALEQALEENTNNNLKEN